MATTTTRLTDPSNNGTQPTAKYLQARISHLSLQLLKRYNALLAAARDPADVLDPDNDDGPAPNSALPAPPPVETASKQLDIEVETTAIIRAAEDIMVLTRSLKELWLFGGLQTVVGEDGQKFDGQGADPKEEEEGVAMAQDVDIVRRGLDEWLQGYVKTLGESRESQNGQTPVQDEG